MKTTYKLSQIFSFAFMVATTFLPASATIWSAHTMDNPNGSKVCFAASAPASSQGTYTKRGPVQLMISHRPKDNVQEEISVEMGYTLDKDSEVTLTIDGAKKFFLFVNGETAWAYDKNDDEKIIKALKSGKTAVIEGKSVKGTNSTDTFHLAGITAACNTIQQDCKTKANPNIVKTAKKLAPKKDASAKNKKSPAQKK